MARTADSRATAQSAIGIGCIFLLSLAVYFPALQGEFLWDDPRLLTNNPLIKDADGLWRIWFSTQQADYFPLTSTSFWLEWRLWGMNPTGYHVTNVLLHALAAVLLWRVFLRMSVPGAWLAATVFAVHPMCVASVAWIAERKNTLSLVFFLLSLLWYLRSDEVSGAKCQRSGNVTRHTSHLTQYYWLSLLAFLLALLSKTSVVILPFVLWLCVWWRRTRNDRGEHPTSSASAQAAVTSRITHQASRITLNVLARTIPFFALALVFGLVTLWFQGLRADESLRDLGLADGQSGKDLVGLLRASGAGTISDAPGVRILAGGWALWFYLWKALWPAQLMAIYPRWQVDVASALAYMPGLLWIGLLALGWRYRRAWGGAIVFGLGYFTVALLPVLGFINTPYFGYSRVADHWAYLALMGVVGLAVGGMAGLAGKWAGGQRGKGAEEKGSSELHPPFPLVSFSNFLVIFTGGVVVALLCALTWRQAGIYASAEKYWTDTVQKNPKAWIAHNNLGIVLVEQGDLEAAVTHLRAAIRLKPNFANPYYGLGMIAAMQDRLDEAIEQQQEALRLRPGFLEAQNSLGVALARRGRWEEAKANFLAVLRARPAWADAHFNLANTLLAQGHLAEAATNYTLALRAQPDMPQAHCNLGTALAGQSRWEEAMAHFSETIRLRPNHAEAHNRLGVALARAGKFEEAIARFNLALQHGIEPAEAHANLGKAYSGQGNFQTAIQHYREALKAKPDWPDALNNLAWVRATHPEASFRDGNEAVKLAERAVELTHHKDAGMLDTLAAAHAEAGRFAEAVTAAKKAMTIATTAGQGELAQEIESRLEAYQTQRPWREP